MAAYTTIDNPELYFQAKLYTGNGSDDHAITFDGSENMSANLIWQKNRTDAVSHGFFDTVRGIDGGSTTYRFLTDSTNGEDDATNTVKSADSNGFTLGTNANLNGSSDANVAWCWKESADAGFDIITWSGNQTQKTISHNLSAVPHWIIVKVRGTAKQWTCYHKDMTADPDNAGIFLQSTAAPTTGTAGYFGNTAPTSSVFTIGSSTNVNNNGSTLWAYTFTSKQGFSKIGSFIGTQNEDGAYVHLGFRPAFVMFKNVSLSSCSWVIVDNKRQSYNGNNNSYLYADTTSAEQTGINVDLLSNGFKTRHNLSWINEETITYIAFAEAPFVNSNGVPCNAR